MVHKYETRKVAIVGARGYSGLELTRILLKHPGAEIRACFATGSGFSLSDYLPEAVAHAVSVFPPIFPMEKLDQLLSEIDTLFLATPAEVSMKLVPLAISTGVDVVDLSGAFRLSAASAREWYGLTDTAAIHLSRAEYGLIPWAGPSRADRSATPRLVSNPGCYATAVLMGLLPLLKAGIVDPESLVIDAKSGASGAGRKATEDLMFCEVDGECLPYRVGRHQHLPEIREAAARFAQVAIDPMFTTHLIPIRRGILAGIYGKLLPGATLETIESAYRSAYSGHALVSAKALDEVGSSGRRELSLKRIAGSARCEIRFSIKDRQLYVFSLIDNLMKGAASQAVENFNRLYDFPLTTALDQLEGLL